jgi:hypothetical protein
MVPARVMGNIGGVSFLSVSQWYVDVEFRMLALLRLPRTVGLSEAEKKQVT